MTISRKAGVIGATLVLIVLAYAWINGGEQALRPIEQSVSLPESPQ